MTFVINNIKWEVTTVPNDDIRLFRSDGSKSVAACDNETKMIYITEDLPTDKLRKVLCHEVTHAAMFSYNVFLSIEQEELLADLIATYGDEIIYVTNKIFKKIKGFDK